MVAITAEYRHWFQHINKTVFPICPDCKTWLGQRTTYLASCTFVFETFQADRTGGVRRPTLFLPFCSFSFSSFGNRRYDRQARRQWLHCDPKRVRRLLATVSWLELLNSFAAWVSAVLLLFYTRKLVERGAAEAATGTGRNTRWKQSRNGMYDRRVFAVDRFRLQVCFHIPPVGTRLPYRRVIRKNEAAREKTQQSSDRADRNRPWEGSHDDENKQCDGFAAIRPEAV